MYECVERRGCQWFICKVFVESPSAYPNARLAYEDLKQIIELETRLRAQVYPETSRKIGEEEPDTNPMIPTLGLRKP